MIRFTKTALALLAGQRASWLPTWISGRRGLIVAAAIPIVGAIILGWPWLVAAGIAPLLLAVAPCAAMCALGLCMRGMSGNACSSTSTQVRGAAPANPKRS